ncbi:metal-sulfur cluster assembly factor [Candidatus Micrarchaeota archaeon]|nr:metal-sulfur cluster assembly factor [Candidatus Micrarchaeota archaeon]
MVAKEEVMKMLGEVMDPELGISIVDLGLVYKVEKKGKKDGKEQFYIEMTFTTPMCPLVNYMLDEVKKKLDGIKGADFDVRVVFDPPWTPERISKETRKRLGLK